jgi:integrase
MVESLPETARGLRDRAILTLGFATGLRRSELVGLTMDDVAKDSDGLVVTLRSSKTDQFARGRRLRALPRNDAACPIRAYEAWLEIAGAPTGPLFRHVRRGGHVSSRPLDPKGIERVVKEAAALIGLDAREFAGHSLRRGFATAQAAGGLPEAALMRRLGHTDPTMTRRYVDEAEQTA